MVVGMTACGSRKEKADSDTPKSGATAFFKALKSQDKDALKDTYSGDSKELLGAMSNQSDDSTTDKVQDALSKQMVEKVYSFDYKIGKESIKDKEADLPFLLDECWERLRNLRETLVRRKILNSKHLYYPRSYHPSL